MPETAKTMPETSTLFDDCPDIFVYGTGDRTDGNIRLENLLDRMPPQTAPLAPMLKQEEGVGKEIKAFNSSNEFANRQQNRYQSARRISYIAGFIATILGILFLFPGTGWLDDPVVDIVLLGLELICVLVILVSRVLWGSAKTHRDYFEARHDAEICRGNFFKQVIDKAKAGTFPGALRPALDFVAYYLLIDQMVYYARRQTTLATKAKKAKWWRRIIHTIYWITFAVSLYSLMLLGVKQGWWTKPPLLDMLIGYFPFLQAYVPLQETYGPFLKTYSEHAGSVLAGMGILVSAVHSLTVSLTRLELCDRNTATYQDMVDDLGRELCKLKEMQDAADKGDAAAVGAYFETVASRLRDEHEDWYRLQKVIMDEL